MPQTYKNSDLVLKINDDSPEVLNVINKYDTYLSSLCSGDYSFQIEAVKNVLLFLFSNKYTSIEGLARENYSGNDKLRQKFERVADYLTKLQLRDKKSCSLDLATGTGKSYVIYALAQICLAEGLVDKVLVLCPSLTIEEGTQRDKGFQDSYKLHENNWKVYGRILKPLTIVVTEKIANCIKVWKELVDFIVEKKGIPFDEAKRKVIWVTSGVPGKDTRDGREIRKIIEHPEKIRKENLQLLKEVDDADNPVEWIVSVSMLTEGWDVKNVFQVVPHEQRAFNSKLLISQVLGRGLRMPP